MLHNHITILLRRMIKNKTFYLINMGGLVIGSACCILILLFIQNELSYDQYHKNADRIYRITHEIKSPHNSVNYPCVYSIVAPLLLCDYPEILSAVRLDKKLNPFVSYKNNNS